MIEIARAYLLYEKSKKPAFSVPKQISDVTSPLLMGILCKQIINICLRKNKSKQSYA